MNESKTFKRRTYEVIKSLNPHEFFLARKNKKFYLKTFDDIDSFRKEIDDYKNITKYGIKVPRMLKCSKKELSILFEYVGEETIDKLLSQSDIDEKIFDQLFTIYRFARFSHIELNYLPENYAFYNGELYYLLHEFSKEDKNRNLENYGIRFWFTGVEGLTHLKELGYEVNNARAISKAELNKKIVLISIMKW